MELQDLTTVAPTALSSAVFVLAHGVFVTTMLRRRSAPARKTLPWVSILKPVAGIDDGLRENLESFARLDYPAFEILFGVADPLDPAVPVLRAFLAARPAFPARIVLTRPAVGRVHNPKVAQLIDLEREARGAVLVVSDANVRVPPSYLRDVVGELAATGVGLVSSLLVGRGDRTFGAAIENAQLGAMCAPAVVAAHALGVRPATIGKSMAMRREDLHRAGGWESVADVLAEDDAMAQRIHALGFEVRVCLTAIENRNERTTAARSLDRHARWAKMRRAIMPASFAAEPLASPLVVATAVALAAPSKLAVALLGAALVLQTLAAYLSLRLVGADRPLRLALMEPVRSAFALAAWGLGWASRRVDWRGNEFVVGAGSRLHPVGPRTRRRARGARLAA